MIADVPKSAVRYAMREAASDCAVLRIAHARSGDCDGTLRCPRCAGLVWAREVFAHWEELSIGADDLEAAVLLLRGAL